MEASATSLDRDIERAISINVDDPSVATATVNPAAAAAAVGAPPPAVAPPAVAPVADPAPPPTTSPTLPRPPRQRQGATSAAATSTATSSNQQIWVPGPANSWMLVDPSVATVARAASSQKQSPTNKRKNGSDGNNPTPRKKRVSGANDQDVELLSSSPFKEQNDPYPTFYPQLVAFKAEHGNLTVSRAKHPELWKFMRKCRDQYRRATRAGNKESRLLTPQRIEELNSLGFQWQRPIKDDNWDEMYPQLVEFQRQHGHCRATGNTDLASFVQQLRKGNYEAVSEVMKENGEGSSNLLSKYVTPERIKLLNDIGFEWKLWNRDPWEQRFFEVQDYKKTHGNCIIGPNFSNSLNGWVKTQRKGYRHFMNMLKADNDRKLAARNDPEGKVPPELDKEYEKLSKKKPMLDADRVVRLQMIDFEFQVVELSADDAWNKHYKELVEFNAVHGHTRVSRNFKENPQLAGWVKHQRRYMTRKMKGEPGGEPLTEERIQRLDAIGFEWRLKPLVIDD